MLTDIRCHDVFKRSSGYYLPRLLLDFLCGDLQRLSQVAHAPFNHLPEFGIVMISFLP